MCKYMAQIIYFLCIDLFLGFVNVAYLPLNLFEQKSGKFRKRIKKALS
jgi:hypothetical protein